MKKALLCATLLTASAAVVAQEVSMPTVYGKMNREFRYVKQEDVFKRKTMKVGTPVENLPSRIGAMGTHKIDDALSFTYLAEIGMYSDSLATSANPTVTATSNDTTPELITTSYTPNSEGAFSLRLASVRINHATLGTIITGQDYTATSLVGLAYDPLFNTGAGQAGFDQAFSDIANASVHIGYYARWRNELIGYQSPKIAGLQFTTTMDSGDEISNAKTANKNYSENLLAYSNKFGDIDVGVHAGYIKGTGTPAAGEEVMMLGTNVKMPSFEIGALYTTRETESGTVKPKETRMLGSFKYKLNPESFVAFTYGNLNVDKHISATTGNADEKDVTQYALGYQYAFNKYVSGTATAMHTKIDFKNPASATAAGTIDNKATSLMTGIALNF